MKGINRLPKTGNIELVNEQIEKIKILFKRINNEDPEFWKLANNSNFKPYQKI